jgi:galactokinase
MPLSWDAAIQRFQSLYPTCDSPRVWRAPGRVNLIGEHTDYNLGLVLPMAIDLACFVFAAPSGDGRLRVYSEHFGESAEWRLEDIAHMTPQGRWSDRVAGVAWALLRNNIAVAGHNLLIDSTVPLGGGLSSSAALGVALTLALGGPREPAEVARLARAAENDFVGVPCGIMDQFISANGRAGAAILLDCRTLEWRAVPLPRELAIVVTNSMLKHDLASSGYSQRVAECHASARTLGIGNLRDAQLHQLDVLDDVPRKRARHVITENARVEAFASAAQRGDLEEMGRLLGESHRSLRDDYEVSCPELDFLVETAQHVPGVLGARMTGGGFGGSTVTLMHPEAIATYRQTVSAAYGRFRGLNPDIHVCAASPGAAEVHGLSDFR